MEQKPIPRPLHLTKGLLSLIAILGALILLLVFIWLWYDVQITSLDKNRQTTPSTQSINH